jgi:hypothetical protein
MPSPIALFRWIQQTGKPGEDLFSLSSPGVVDSIPGWMGIPEQRKATATFLTAAAVWQR